MKKKYVIRIIIIFLLAYVLIIKIKGQTKIEYVHRDANFDRIILTHEPIDLFSESTEIIIGEVRENKKNNLIKDEFDNSILFGYTSTEIQVVSSYKGNVDNVIIVVEEYWTEGNYLYSDNYYEPLVPGEKYILFLKKNPDQGSYSGTYYIVDATKGKYPIISNDNEKLEVENLTHKDLLINSKTDLSNYKKWYKFVLKEIDEKYKK